MKVIPKGVRSLIYSYLEYQELMSHISRLSKDDRDTIGSSQNIDQVKLLSIDLKANTFLK